MARSNFHHLWDAADIIECMFKAHLQSWKRIFRQGWEVSSKGVEIISSGEYPSC